MAYLVAQAPPPSGVTSDNAIAVHSNLVLVPTFVKTKQGEIVFSLDTEDFTVTDDGVPQKIRLDPDADAQPLALAIVVQTGALGAMHVQDYRELQTVLEAIIGNVPHRVSVVSFDSRVRLEHASDEGTEHAAEVLDRLKPGDQGAAILDAMTFATAELARQPAQYRRAMLLLSETIDRGSQKSLDETLRAIDDTNTTIYSFAFSSTAADFKHEKAKLPNPFMPTKYSRTPYNSGGCMAQGSDPDAHGKRSVQALDCAGDLLPPLRIARMTYLAAIDGMHRNIPETVATLTGGEYADFKDSKGLRQKLVAISNDVHNQYVLSFQPETPHPGLHSLSVTLRVKGDLVVTTRNAYWIDTPANP
jgi:VWFA-related protein